MYETNYLLKAMKLTILTRCGDFQLFNKLQNSLRIIFTNFRSVQA